MGNVIHYIRAGKMLAHNLEPQTSNFEQTRNSKPESISILLRHHMRDDCDAIPGIDRNDGKYNLSELLLSQ